MHYSVGWGLSTGGFLPGNYGQEVTLGRKTQAGPRPSQHRGYRPEARWRLPSPTEPLNVGHARRGGSRRASSLLPKTVSRAASPSPGLHRASQPAPPEVILRKQGALERKWRKQKWSRSASPRPHPAPVSTPRPQRRRRAEPRWRRRWSTSPCCV